MTNYTNEKAHDDFIKITKGNGKTNKLSTR